MIYWYGNKIYLRSQEPEYIYENLEFMRGRLYHVTITINESLGARSQFHGVSRINILCSLHNLMFDWRNWPTEDLRFKFNFISVDVRKIVRFGECCFSWLQFFSYNRTFQNKCLTMVGFGLVWFGFVVFYGLLTIVSHSIPNSVYTNMYFIYDLLVNSL